MDRFSTSEERFRECLKRCRGICDLENFLSVKHAKVLDTSDMLRTSVVLCVSAFDYLIHEIYRIEVIERFRHKKNVKRQALPFSVVTIEKSEVESIIDAHVRKNNSYKSFVDPGKYAEAMGCFVEAPWEKVAIKVGQNACSLKSRIRTIYRWRNRIAHEADINPVYSGVEFWPIEPSDVLNAVRDVEEVGIASVEILREA